MPSKNNNLASLLAEKRAQAKKEEEELAALGGRYYATVEQIEKAQQEVAKARDARRGVIREMRDAGWSRAQIATVTGLNAKTLDEALRNEDRSEDRHHSNGSSSHDEHVEQI